MTTKMDNNTKITLYIPQIVSYGTIIEYFHNFTCHIGSLLKKPYIMCHIVVFLSKKCHIG